MQRIDNSTAVTSLPTPKPVGPNPNGYFSRGNPQAGTPATIVDDDWANAVQEELCNVIENAGLTLDKNDRTQLAQAISIIAGVLSVHSHQNGSEGGTLDASAIASGTFDDSRITQSNVTQHQGAIDHGAISGLNDNDHPQYAQKAADETVSGNWNFNNEILLPDIDPPTANHANRNGIVKGWVTWHLAGGGNIDEEYNIDSVVDTGSGSRSVYWDVDFNDFRFPSICSTNGNSGYIVPRVETTMERTLLNTKQLIAGDFIPQGVDFNLIAIGAQ